jgi:hypothetical protein
MEIGSSAVIAQQLANQRQQRFGAEEANSSYIAPRPAETNAVQTQLTRAVQEPSQEEKVRNEASEEALQLAANGNLDSLRSEGAEIGQLLDISV